SGNVQGRVPKRVPLFLFHHHRRDRSESLFQGRDLRCGNSALAAGHLKLRRQIAPQDRPWAARLTCGELVNERPRITKRKSAAQRLTAFTLPGHVEDVAANGSM